MSVRVKVRCNRINGNEVTFTTVYEDPTKEYEDQTKAENARFTTVTPWGEIKLGIDNPTAIGQFGQGKEYYVDFTPAG